MPNFKVSRYEANKKQAQLPAPIKILTRKQKNAIIKAEATSSMLKKTASTFGIKRKDIILAIDNGDIDGALSTFRKTAYSAVIALIPIAEKEYRKGKRESQAYAFNALIQSARELGQDLEASNDRAALAESLVRTALEPMFKDLLQKLLQQQVLLKGFLNDKVMPKHIDTIAAQLDVDIRESAAFMQDLYEKTAITIKRAVNGE
jgi:hypothetical protein